MHYSYTPARQHMTTFSPLTTRTMLSSYSNNEFSPSTSVLTSTILTVLTPSINPSLHSEYPASKPGSPIPSVARLSNILCNFLLTTFVSCCSPDLCLSIILLYRNHLRSLKASWFLTSSSLLCYLLYFVFHCFLYSFQD